MSAPSPLWCANDEPHAAHRERNEFNGWNECSGRPRLPQARSKAQQAAERAAALYVDQHYVDDAGPGHWENTFLEGVAWALPENPDPAVIEAMATAYPAAYQRAVQNARKGPDGISREEAHRCYVEAMTAAYAALRGAMQ